MFEKLLSVLPYNPSLVQQLSFYGKRMRREAAVRRTGVVFLLLAFFVQFFAFLSPPQPTVANSTNDIVNGGITSVADAVSKCRNNAQNYRLILENYGITCDILAKTTTVSLRSTDSNKQLYSMGRLAYGQTNTRTGKLTGETPVNIAGVGTFYYRYLWSFDSGAYSTYTALKGTSSLGKTFYILYNCANPVFAGIPAPKPTPAPAPTPKPSFTVVKGVKLSNQNTFKRIGQAQNTYYTSVTAKPGDVVDFSIDLTNTGNTTLSPIMRDTLPAGLTAVPGSLAADGKQVTALIANYNTGNMVPGQFRRVTFSAKVAAPANGCVTYTNVVAAQAGTLPIKESSAKVDVCKPSTVTPTTPAPTPTPTPTPVPVVPVVTPTPTPTTPPAPCAYNLNLPASSPDCKPCDKSVSTADSLACLVLSKKAANVSLSIADANGTTAQAGNTILYTLTAENKGKATIKDFVFQDSMSDVLDYADITNLYGGTKTAENAVIWPAVDIEAGQSVSVKVAVTVKAEIPTTPQVAGTGHFDHVMTNVYANAININLPQATVVQIQTTATTLPKTGPAETLAATAAVVVLAAYFYSRSRLLAYETNVVIRDNNSGGF